MPGIGCSGRYMSRSIWLNNNCLSSIGGLSSLVNATLQQPAALGWVDLSHNFIRDIHCDLLQFPNLRIIYLHGNLICNLQEVFKLRCLRCLRTLTLHGNPIETVHHYRRHVVRSIPQLLNLDFAPVIAKERKDPDPPCNRIKIWKPAKPWVS